MRRSTAPIRVELPGGEVLLCRLSGRVEAILMRIMPDGEIDKKAGPTPAQRRQAASALLEHFVDLVAAGAFTGWENVSDDDEKPRPFRAAELDQLLTLDERMVLVAGLVEASRVGDVLADVAAEAGPLPGGADPTAPTDANGGTSSSLPAGEAEPDSPVGSIAT